MLPEAINNKNLFSNHYLENFIQNNSEWDLDVHEEAFDEIKKIYETNKDKIKTVSEAQLEDIFLRTIFKVINPFFIPQAKTDTQEFPDYAFYPDNESQDKAYGQDFPMFSDCIAIGEAKKWDVKLGRKQSKQNKFDYPSFQLWMYLKTTGKTWGILTNGKEWRILRNDKLADTYYEVDLAKILDEEDIESFRYFYYFFRKEAFIQLDDGDIFLERIYKRSIDYAKELGDDLKDKVYQAMKILADGFIENPANGLDKNNLDDLASVQQSTMRLLYRMLFLLYAEGKELFDMKNPKYRNELSLYNIKKAIFDEITGKEKAEFKQYWAHLKYLCMLINEGSEKFPGLGAMVNIPPYNGGLFSPEKNPNLEKWDISDQHIEKAIRLLSIGTERKGFIDYSTLDIRHLGSIYEGLLEFKLKIAENDMVASGGKSKVWTTLEEHNKKRKIKQTVDDFVEFNKVVAGDVYLATDKGERKATGSYYTPDYIVEYIVENTVGPIVEEKWKEAEKNKASLSETILTINVLDPAMGSGHFLVGATDFLANKLMEALEKDRESKLKEDDESHDIGWAKREVVSHCIYGVDLNEMAVELAKLSLWLNTISRDKPLSFLDHRLKHGNSLIGASMVDLPWHPKKKQDKKQKRIDIPEGFIKKFVETIDKLDSIDDDSLDNIRQKEQIFENLKNTIEYDKIKTLADVRTSIYFGNEIEEKTYMNYTNSAYYDAEKQWEDKKRFGFSKRAREIANEKIFFHWELEFPEVFFEGGQMKENPGFDAVIGNPPYVSNWELTAFDETLPSSLEKMYPSISYGHWDLFVLFSYKAISLTRLNGLHSFIVPNAYAMEKYGAKLRHMILTTTHLKQLVDFGEEHIFEDVARQYLIYVVSPLYDENLLTEIVKYKNGFLKHVDVKQNIFLNFTNNTFRMDLTNIDLKMKDKIEINDLFFGNLCCVNVGVVAHSKAGSPIKFIKNDVILIEKANDGCMKYIEGEDIGRYSIKWKGLFIDYGEKKDFFHRPKFPELFDSRKLIIRRVSGANNKILSCYDDNKYYTNDNVMHSIKWTPEIVKLQSPDKWTIDVDTPKYILTYLESLINSTLMSYYFSNFLATDTLQSSYTGIYPQDVRRLPIRRINFTTPEPARKDLASKGEALYQEYIKNGSQAILDFIEDCLPKDADGNFITKKEKSDVVHDLLAFLAERMIGMNKEKQAEIKGFLEWLERYIEVNIDDLKLKTKLKGYYDNDWDVFRKALEKNNKNIEKDISRREHLEKIKDEFDSSMAKLAPLMERIQKTDELIDQIVYKLYGLTEKEIRIVEGVE